MDPLTHADPGRIDAYELLARLGAGGFGQVYLARSPGGRLAAVKVIHAHNVGDAGFRRRFRREVEAAKSVSGFFTAPVIAADPDSEPPWLATAHVPGPNLDAAVKEHGPLPGRMVTALAAALAEALTAIHSADLVHRDLKPSNILLARDGPRVIDFGIVHAAETTEMTKGLIGTPGYLSPEQARNEEIGPVSDVFSLGCVLYFAATGRPPFGTDSVAAVLYRLVAEEPDFDGVPVAHRRLVTRCMAKDPTHRPTPQGLLEELAPQVSADAVDWAAGPYATMIDSHTAEISQYAAPEPPVLPPPAPPPAPAPVPPGEVAAPERAGHGPADPPAAPARTERAEPGPAPPVAPEPTELDPTRSLDSTTAPPRDPAEPAPRPPGPTTFRLKRAAAWAVVLTVAAVSGVVVLSSWGDSGEGAGFRPWSLDDAFGMPVVADGLVSIGRPTGTAAYDARTGRRRWVSTSGDQELTLGRYGDHLLVRSKDTLSGLEAATGARRWSLPLSEDGCVADRPDRSGNVAVLEEIERPDRRDDLQLSVVDAATGKRQWSRTLPRSSCPSIPSDVSGERINVRQHGDTIEDQVVVSYAASSGASLRLPRQSEVVSQGENVYVLEEGDQNVRLRALAGDGARSRWEVEIPAGDDDGTVAASDSGVFVQIGGQLHAFDGTNGARLWGPVDVRAFGDLAVHGAIGYLESRERSGMLFWTSFRTRFIGVDLRTGRRLWTHGVAAGASLKTAGRSTVYIGGHDKRFMWRDDHPLIALDARTGEERWRKDMDTDAITLGSEAVYVVHDFHLQALRASDGVGP